jgi:hypothetical protein
MLGAGPLLGGFFLVLVMTVGAPMLAFAGSGDEVRPADPVADPAAEAAAQQQRDSDLATIQKVVESKGTATVSEWIRARRHGRITVEVGGRLKPSFGPPNHRFVTAASVLYDLQLAKVDVATFAREVAGLEPQAPRDVVISQQDVGGGGHGGSSTGGSPASAPMAPGEIDVPEHCRSAARAFALRHAAERGCGDGRVESLDGADKAKLTAEVYMELRGTCADTESGAVRRFESTIRCSVKPVGGVLWVEGSDEPITVSTGCGLVAFRFVGEPS